MSTSAIGTVLDALSGGFATALDVAGLTVNVFSGRVPITEAGLACVAFGDGRLDETEATSHGNRDETWRIEGEIRVAGVPWAGTTELTIRAARAQVLQIFAVLETYLNDTYTGSLPDVSIVAGEISNGFGSDGRTCGFGFDLVIQTTKNP